MPIRKLAAYTAAALCAACTPQQPDQGRAASAASQRQDAR